MGRTLQVLDKFQNALTFAIIQIKRNCNLADQRVDRTMTPGGQLGKLKVLLKNVEAENENIGAVAQQVIYSLVNQLSLLIVICAKYC